MVSAMIQRNFLRFWWLCARGLSPSVTGSILSRQAYSLADRSKPHVRVAVSALLADILDVYDPVRFPVRRAQALVCVLEHTYYDRDENVSLENFSPESVIHEAEVLLSEKASAGFSQSVFKLTNLSC